MFVTNLFGCGGDLKDLLAAAFERGAGGEGSFAVCLLFGTRLLFGTTFHFGTSWLIFGTRLIKGFCLSNTSLICLLGAGFRRDLQSCGGRFLGGPFGRSWRSFGG